MSVPDIAVIAIIVIVAALALVCIIRRGKNGGCCSGGCDKCTCGCKNASSDEKSQKQ